MPNPTSSAKTVLILGGGVGGISAARTLGRRLPREHRIRLIEREQEHTFPPSLVWLMVDLRKADGIKRPLRRLVPGRVDVVLGEIEQIDPASRTLEVNGQRMAGDYIVVSLGADLAPEATPGLANAGHNFYALAGAAAFRDELRLLKAGRVVVLTAASAYKCPAAPYEAAMLIDHFCRKHGTRGRSPSWRWHAVKVLFEMFWLARKL